MEHSSTKPKLPVVERTLAILEALAESREPLSFPSIVGTIGASNAATSRLLSVLIAHGYVQRVGTDHYYELGLQSFRLGRLPLKHSTVRAAAISAMRVLNGISRETIVLSVYANGEAIYIETVNSPQPVSPTSYVGFKAPATCISTGLVLFSNQSDDHIRDVLSRPLKSYTDNTIVDPQALWEMTRDIRQQNYAVNNDGYRHGVSGIAVPIFKSANKVIASIGYCIPTYRFNNERMSQLLDKLKEQGNLISQNLGHFLS